jgi:DNA-binding MarR family transcriptional regulator
MTNDQIKQIIWRAEASPAEILIILRLYDFFGKSFETTLENLQDVLGYRKDMISKYMKGLKELGWIKSEMVYGQGPKLSKVIRGCRYEITVIN